MRSVHPRFPALDLRSLAAFRVGLGAIVLVDLAGRVGDRATLYASGELAGLGGWPLYGPGTSLALVTVLFAIHAAAAVALVLGVRPRLAAATTWFLLLCLHGRNSLVLNAGDALLRLLLLWSIFLPLGARFAFDARRAAPSAVLVRSPATLALAVQVVSVYAFTLILKSGGAWWPRGTALYLALSNDALATGLGHALTAWPSLLRVLTYAVLVIEAVAPLLLVAPRARHRLAGAAALAGLHLGIALFMRVGLFPLVSLVAVLPFLPPELWRGIGAAPHAGGASPRAARPLHAVCLICLAGVLVRDVGSVIPAARPPGPVLAALAAAGLDHRWDMFAPGPPSTHDEMLARLIDGDAARDVPLRPANARWRKYFEHLGRDHDALALLRHLCHTTGAHRVALYRLAYPIPARGQPAAPPDEHRIADLTCAPSSALELLAHTERP